MKLTVKFSIRLTRDKPEPEQVEAPDIYDLSGAQVEQGPIGFMPNEFNAEHIRSYED